MIEKKTRDAASALKDKVIIITGASSGIGKSLALEVASRGATVVISSRNVFRLPTVADEIIRYGGTCLSVIADVTKKSECKYLVDTTIEKYGRIDVLINNAGISMRALFNELDISVFEKVLNTNFMGAVYCTKYALPHILKHNGSIVAISSISGLTPLPARTAYVASKYAMDGFFESLRLENKANDLHVLIAHPSFTNTNIRNSALKQHGETQKTSPRKEDKMMSSTLVARLVVKALIKRRGNLILTFKAKLLVWTYKIIPALAERVIFNGMKKEEDAPF